VASRLELLKKLKAEGDIHGLMYVLRQDLQKSAYGTASVELFKACNNGTKIDLELFHNELIESIKYIYYYKGTQITHQEKVEFFQSIRQSYGRTALMLSGGASFCQYHNGIIKALYECDLIPRVICGTSAGSFFAAGLCCLKPYEFGLAGIYEVAC